MAKQANRMMIGGFVVIALFILAASLVVFGSGKFFQKTQKFVLFFDGSVKGLSVGAPVLFQGVQIGSVISITIVADPVKQKVEIPVIIAIELDRFNLRVAGQTVDPQKNMPQLIDKGLRAVLTMQSFITGQLLIELNLYPDSPVNLVKNVDLEYTEIPTIPSTSQKLADALKELDVKKLEKHLDSTLSGIDRIVNNPDLMASIKGLKETLQDARKLITKVDRQVNPLANGVRNTAKDFGRLANGVDSQVKELGTSLDKSLSGLDKTMSAVRGVISADAPLVVELESTLKELSTMSRSIRELADYLDQHPASLIFGKKKPGGKERCN